MSQDKERYNGVARQLRIDGAASVPISENIVLILVSTETIIYAHSGGAITQSASAGGRTPTSKIGYQYLAAAMINTIR